MRPDRPFLTGVVERPGQADEHLRQYGCRTFLRSWMSEVDEGAAARTRYDTVEYEMLLDVLESIVGDEGSYAIEAHRGLIKSLHGIRETILDYTNIVVWLHKYSEVSSSCTNKTHHRDSMLKRYDQYRVQINNTKNEVDTIERGASPDGDGGAVGEVTKRLGKKKDNPGGGGVIGRTPEQDPDTAERDNALIRNNQQRIRTESYNLELDEHQLDEHLDAIRADFPLLAHHSMQQPRRGKDPDLDDEDDDDGQGRLPPLCKMTSVRRELLTKLFARMFHPIHSIHNEMDDLRVLINRVRATARVAGRQEAELFDGLFNEGRDRFKYILQATGKGEEPLPYDLAYEIVTRKEKATKMKRGRITSTGPTFLLDNHEDGFKRNLGIDYACTSSNNGRNEFLVNSIGVQVLQGFGRSNPLHKRVMEDIAETLRSLRMRHAPQDNRDYQWLDADGEAGVGSIILSAGQRASQRALSIAGEKSRRGRAIESVKRLYKRLSQVETAVYSLQAMQRQAMTVLESCRAAVHMVAYSVKILQDVPEERELQREARHCAELSEDYIQSPLLELQLQSTHGRPERAAYTEDGIYKSWCSTRPNPMHTGAIFSILGALVDTDEISTQKLKPEAWDSKIAAAEKRLAKLVQGECKAPQQIAKRVKRIEREELRIDRLKQQRDSSKNIAAEIEIAQDRLDSMDVDIKRVDKELLRLASMEEDSKTADHARNTERATQELDDLMAHRDVLKNELRGLQDVARNNDRIDLFTFIGQMYPLDEAAGINKAISVSLDSATVEKYEEHDLDLGAVDVFTDGDLEQQPSVRIHYPDRSEPVPPVARSDPDLTDARAGGVSSGGEHSEDYWIGAGKEICTQIAGLKYFVAKEMATFPIYAATGDVYHGPDGTAIRIIASSTYDPLADPTRGPDTHDKMIASDGGGEQSEGVGQESYLPFHAFDNTDASWSTAMGTYVNGVAHSPDPDGHSIGAGGAGQAGTRYRAGSPGEWIMIDLGARVPLRSYMMCGADESRQPMVYTWFGSDDPASWSLVDHAGWVVIRESVGNSPTGKWHTGRFAELTRGPAFRYYLLVVHKLRGPCERLVLTEIVLRGEIITHAQEESEDEAQGGSNHESESASGHASEDEDSGQPLPEAGTDHRPKPLGGDEESSDGVSIEGATDDEYESESDGEGPLDNGKQPKKDQYESESDGEGPLDNGKQPKKDTEKIHRDGNGGGPIGNRERAGDHAGQSSRDPGVPVDNAQAGPKAEPASDTGSDDSDEESDSSYDPTGDHGSEDSEDHPEIGSPGPTGESQEEKDAAVQRGLQRRERMLERRRQEAAWEEMYAHRIEKERKDADARSGLYFDTYQAINHLQLARSCSRQVRDRGRFGVTAREIDRAGILAGFDDAHPFYAADDEQSDVLRRAYEFTDDQGSGGEGVVQDGDRVADQGSGETEMRDSAEAMDIVHAVVQGPGLRKLRFSSNTSFHLKTVGNELIMLLTQNYGLTYKIDKRVVATIKEHSPTLDQVLQIILETGHVQGDHALFRSQAKHAWGGQTQGRAYRNPQNWDAEEFIDDLLGWITSMRWKNAEMTTERQDVLGKLALTSEEAVHFLLCRLCDRHDLSPGCVTDRLLHTIQSLRRISRGFIIGVIDFRQSKIDGARIDELVPLAKKLLRLIDLMDWEYPRLAQEIVHNCYTLITGANVADGSKQDFVGRVKREVQVLCTTLFVESEVLKRLCCLVGMRIQRLILDTSEDGYYKKRVRDDKTPDERGPSKSMRFKQRLHGMFKGLRI